MWRSTHYGAKKKKGDRRDRPSFLKTTAQQPLWRSRDLRNDHALVRFQFLR
jgi:hypothetical protein